MCHKIVINYKYSCMGNYYIRWHVKNEIYIYFINIAYKKALTIHDKRNKKWISVDKFNILIREIY